MDKFDRAVRRHHYYRLKYNRKGNYNRRHNNMHVNTPALCSCPYCSTPRKLGEVTVQEKRNLQRFYQDI